MGARDRVETRGDATSRVTAAIAAWFWRRGSRIIVAEVGLSGMVLLPSWGCEYRVDLVAVLGDRTHVIEVKGTTADLAREDLGAGKWILNHSNLTTWLAVDTRVKADLYARLPAPWGLLTVDGERVRVTRRAREVDDQKRTGHLEVLGSVLCMQSLPQMMGHTHAGQLAALETAGFDRPWRRWIDAPRAPRCEEPGNLL